MKPQLTEQLDQAIRALGSPCPVIGADNVTEYVILTSDQFESYCRLFDQGPLTMDEQLAALRHVGERSGWDDPEMDAYDDYDSHRSSR